MLRWTDVTDIEKKAGLLQETVKVSTRWTGGVLQWSIFSIQPYLLPGPRIT